MKVTDEITDERTRKYLMVWVDENGEKRGLEHFKGKKSQLPETIVVVGSDVQKVCKLEQVKMVNDSPWAVYRFSWRSYRKWFVM